MDELKLSAGDMEGFKRTIIAGIASMVEESNSNGVVVAVSGGLDSSVVLKLASLAKVDTYALIMPDVGVTKLEDQDDAKELAKELRIRYSKIEINDIFNSIRDSFPWHEFNGDRRIAEANIKPRIRMLLNYITANLDKRIVLGTGNKSEILLGYMTKYGDSGCDLEPVGDLYKTQVKELAVYLGIPDEIIEKTPSAGLWKDQTDEGELGMSYDLIDKILYYSIEEKKSAEYISEKLDSEVRDVEGILGRVEENRHKSTAPPIMKLFN